MSTNNENDDDEHQNKLNDDLFRLWCCSDKLCLTPPFNNPIYDYSHCPSNNNNHHHHHQQQPPPPPPQQQQQPSKNKSTYFNIINLDSCSLGSACDQQDSSTDCHCCQAGCPPSPNQECSECNQTNKNNLINHAHPKRLMSPSVASTGLSANEMDDLSHHPNQNQSNIPIDQDIVWVNKELEELIKCCCCDQPTQSETLPLHHADAHPTHHVNFDMLFNPSINLSNKSNLGQSDHHIPCITPNGLTSTNQSDHDPGFVSAFKCQWNDCNLNFDTRLELTEHVNLCHLFHSTSIASNPSIQANHNTTTLQRNHQPTSNILTSDHRSYPTIPATDLLSNQIDNFLLDSQSSSFAHPPTKTSSSIQSFSDQIHSPSRLLNQENLLSPNSSTLISKSSCESIYDFLTHHQTPTHNLVSLSVDEHQLQKVQGSFPSLNPSPPVASSIELAVKSQTGTKNLETIHDLNANSARTEQHVCRWQSCTGKSFSSTAELTEHLSNDHIGSGKSSYVCLWENCFCDGKSSKSTIKEQKQAEGERVQNLDHHENGSINSKGWERKVFNQRQKIMRHLQTHTGDRPFECERCGKRFGEMATLVQHRRTHTQEKPYKCLVKGCEKSFALQSALTIHTRTHTGLKPFKCPIAGCKSEFSESSNLSKHLKIHSHLKKFSCHICNKRFTRSDQLQRHLKSDSIHQNYNLSLDRSKACNLSSLDSNQTMSCSPCTNQLTTKKVHSIESNSLPNSDHSKRQKK